MNFNIAALTDKGAERIKNQDRILIQESVFSCGTYSFMNIEECLCFVADGIGGGPTGEFAAQFVLDNIANRITRGYNYSNKELTEILRAINKDLIATCKKKPEHRGSGTTLSGIIIHKDYFKIINVGDSSISLFRNKSLINITETQVLNPIEENSPIINYFGGYCDELFLKFDTVLKEIKCNDKILLYSDGLIKALSQKQIKAILSNSKPIENKVQFILKQIKEKHSRDNVSCILVEVVN